MKTLTLVAIGGVTLAATIIGCSREDREEALDRVGRATRALNGTDEQSSETPKIVKEQQRKERIRRNSEWTPENQALHPIEYCQAQLEEVAKYGRQLDVQMHRLATTRSSVVRQIGEGQGRLKQMEKFLVDAKAAYRAAEAANKWPVKIAGFDMSKEKAQDKIVEAAQRIPQLRNGIQVSQNNLVGIDRKSSGIATAKSNLARVRERLEASISDLKTKKVLEGEKGISDALDAINDSIASFNAADAGPTLDELIQPDVSQSREELFRAVMTE